MIEQGALELFVSGICLGKGFWDRPAENSCMSDGNVYPGEAHLKHAGRGPHSPRFSERRRVAQECPRRKPRWDVEQSWSRRFSIKNNVLAHEFKIGDQTATGRRPVSCFVVATEHRQESTGRSSSKTRCDHRVRRPKTCPEACCRPHRILANLAGRSLACSGRPLQLWR